MFRAVERVAHDTSARNSGLESVRRVRVLSPAVEVEVYGSGSVLEWARAHMSLSY